MSMVIMRAVVCGAVALAGATGVSVARADSLRIAIVTADNDADYKSNAAMLPTFADLLKKGGAKAVYVGTDAEHMAITSSSVWASADDIAKVTGSADWKAAAGKLKNKSYVTEIFEVQP